VIKTALMTHPRHQGRTTMVSRAISRLDGISAGLFLQAIYRFAHPRTRRDLEMQVQKGRKIW
jgi:hypothetical protein